MPSIILRKGDYNIYDLLHKAVFGDKTKVFDSILPVVDHWHPVKGALEALCGLKTAASPVSNSALLHFRDGFQLVYVSRVVCAHDLLTSTSPAGLPKVWCDYDGNLPPPSPLLRSRCSSAVLYLVHHARRYTRPENDDDSQVRRLLQTRNAVCCFPGADLSDARSLVAQPKGVLGTHVLA